METIVPQGWRLLTIDYTVDNMVFITLMRDGDNLKKWQALDDTSKLLYDLNKTGFGKTYAEALEVACIIAEADGRYF